MLATRSAFAPKMTVAGAIARSPASIRSRSAAMRPFSASQEVRTASAAALVDEAQRLRGGTLTNDERAHLEVFDAWVLRPLQTGGEAEVDASE